MTDGVAREAGPLGTGDGQRAAVGTGGEGLGLRVGDAEVEAEGQEEHHRHEEEADDHGHSATLVALRCAPAGPGHEVYSHWKFPFDPRFTELMKGTGNGGDDV